MKTVFYQESLNLGDLNPLLIQIENIITITFMYATWY